MTKIVDRTKRKIRKAIAISTVTALMLSLTGCEGPSKSELQEENQQLISTIMLLEREIDDLQTTLKGLSKEYSVKTAINRVGTKGTKESFNKINDNIVFPVELTYPNSTQAPNNSKFQLANNVSIVPSNNWMLISDGTSVDLNHTSGISGNFKVVRINKTLKPEELNQPLDDFLKAFPSESKHYYEHIFIENYPIGIYANVETLIEEKPANIKAGLIGSANTGVLFVFCYEGESDATKNELVSNLIKSLQINNSNIKFE